MPTLSLTDFIDIAGKAGTPKATKIAEVKNRPAYNPVTDFYKKLREAIISTHQKQKPKSNLDTFLNELIDVKKAKHYSEAVKGYKKWWGKKTLNWFIPPKAEYTSGKFSININPELGLDIDGKRHVVKLYLKSEHVTKLRMDVVTELMSVTLGALCKKNETLGLLDVRNSKLFVLGKANAVTKALIDAEMAYITAIWPNV